jgi:hypothetical protein
MIVQLKDKKSPITAAWCFSSKGYDSSIIDKINSGKTVSVERVPKSAWQFIKEIKQKKDKGE